MSRYGYLSLEEIGIKRKTFKKGISLIFLQDSKIQDFYTHQEAQAHE